MEPGHELTDVDFTGHRQQDDLGLTFMRARFFVQGIGRPVTRSGVFGSGGYHPDHRCFYSLPPGHVSGVAPLAQIVGGNLDLHGQIREFVRKVDRDLTATPD